MNIVTDFRSARFTPGLTNTMNYIVIHHTASGNATINSMLRFFGMTKVVSIHYLVAKDGTIHYLVPEDKVAWHCGVSKYDWYTDMNPHCIGIEVLSDGKEYTNEQREAVWKLCKAIMKRRGIKPHRVLRHADVAMPRGRKSDISEPFYKPWGTWGDFQSALMRNKIFSNL